MSCLNWCVPYDDIAAVSQTSSTDSQRGRAQTIAAGSSNAEVAKLKQEIEVCMLLHSEYMRFMWLCISLVLKAEHLGGSAICNFLRLEVPEQALGARFWELL